MDLASFTALLSSPGQELLADLPAYDESSALAVATRLGKVHPPELVAAALTQNRLRARARAKFGDLAERMYFTPAGLEQATRAEAATHRAARIRRAGMSRVADLCCGIGGDLLALGAAAAPGPGSTGIARTAGSAGTASGGPGEALLGVDCDPLTLAVAAANLAALGPAPPARLVCADVTALHEVGIDLRGYDATFCDPSRRTGDLRRFDVEAWSPPYSWLVELARHLPATAAKVAPGIPHQLIPPGVEAEWVSVGGDVVEAALWWGPLSSRVRRRATLLPTQPTHTAVSPTGATRTAATLTDEGMDAAPLGAPSRPVGRYLYEPDGAVIRAGLVAQVAAMLDGWLLDPAIAYVSGDRLTATPYATAYEVTDVLPFALKPLRALLRSRGVGSVVVKKRGSAVDPDQLRHRLRLDGPNHAVVMLTRLHGRPTALLAQPVNEPNQAQPNQGTEAG